MDRKFYEFQRMLRGVSPQAANDASRLKDIWQQIKETMNAHKYPNNMRRIPGHEVDYRRFNADLEPLYDRFKTIYQRLEQELSGELPFAQEM